jgi:uncharacterized membrane protein
MNTEGVRTRDLADWLALAAGLALLVVGVVLIWRPDTAILRLATLGLPGWPVYVAGAAQVVSGAALPFRRTRRAAALVLVLMALARGLVDITYRDTDAALEALAQAVLAGAVLGLAVRRR